MCKSYVTSLPTCVGFVCLHATSDSSTASTTTSDSSTTTSESTTEAELTLNGGQNSAGSDVASAADFASLRVENGTGDVDTSTRDEDDGELTSGFEDPYSIAVQYDSPSPSVDGPAAELEYL